MAVNQKQGVYDAVQAFHQENDLHFEDGMKVELTKEQRSTIVGMVAAAMIAGEVSLSEAAREKHNTDAKITKYCDGLVNNWLRKDTRLNGGVKHEIKNPGSRAGQGDEQLKNLKLLHKTLDDDEQKTVVQAEIDKRIEELRAEKQKNVEINFDVIPDDLKEKLGLTEEDTQ